MSVNILERIACSKRIEVEAMKRVMPEDVLRRRAFGETRPTVSMSGSVSAHDTGIIAEHKRCSPSKGLIAPMSDVGRVARSYAENGAAAMSVLTDTPYFGGSLDDLAVARECVPGLPLLRKEFVVDEYQLYQARIFGADAVLLIAAMISGDEIRCLNDIAHELGLETLVEIHSAAELSAVPEDCDMVGVNNRDLTSFSTDLSNSAVLIDSLPCTPVKIAESGIRTPEDVCRLKRMGFDGFLIGEAFMSTPDPGNALRLFIERNRE